MHLSSHDFAESTAQFLVSHPVFRPWVPLASGLSYAVLSVVIPDESMSYLLKVALALPVGCLTGLGTALSAYIVRRILGRKKPQ